MVRKGFLVLLAALLVPALAAAYTMVLKDGRKIEAQSRYVMESGVVKFTGADGRAYQFPLAQVDLVAPNRANQSRQPEPACEDGVQRRPGAAGRRNQRGRQPQPRGQRRRRSGRRRGRRRGRRSRRRVQAAAAQGEHRRGLAAAPGALAGGG